MGGYDKRLHTTTMVYSKVDQTMAFVVSLRKIYLRQGGGGNSVKSSKAGLRVEALDIDDEVYEQYRKVSIDSGTTDSYFPYGLNSAFRKLWEELAGREYNHERMFLTTEELDDLPTILLQLKGHPDLNKDIHEDPTAVPGLAANFDPDNPYDIIIAIPPSHYMQHDSGSRGYVARYYFDERSSTACVGANTMMGHDVLFDVEEGAMGFAESHCDYAKIEGEVAEEEENEKGLDAETLNADPEVTENQLAKESNNESGALSSWLGFIALIGFLASGLGFIAYNRFVARKFSGQRQHQLVPTNEETSDLELELQYVPPTA